MIAEYPAVVEGTFPNVKVCRVGAQLAGTLSKSDSSTGGRRKAFDLISQIQVNSFVFFSFGEIDCRAHIVRRSNFDDAQIAGTVQTTVDGYLSFVSDFKKEADDLNLNVGVISPPPTSSTLHPAVRHPSLSKLSNLARTPIGRVILRLARNFVPRKSKLNEAIWMSITYSGSEMQRRLASKLFVEKLSEGSNRLGIAFIDMHTPFLSEDGSCDAKWFWDTIHLKKSAVDEVKDSFVALGIDNFGAPVADK